MRGEGGTGLVEDADRWERSSGRTCYRPQCDPSSRVVRTALAILIRNPPFGDVEVIPLQSGSSGNCVFVRVGDTRLIFDAGISGKKAAERLSRYGHRLTDCDALVISHDHSDHVASMPSISRRYELPVAITEATLDAVAGRRDVGTLFGVRHFRAGEPFAVGDAIIHTIRTPHDARDGVCFVVEDRRDGRRFGLMTDLGHVFGELRDWMPTLDAVLIESNYDDGMLFGGPYPRRLKERISGPRGHLSNVDAAKLIRDHAGDSLRWVCLGHLSDKNNSPVFATHTARKYLPRHLTVHVADRYDAIPPMRLSKRPAVARALF